MLLLELTIPDPDPPQPLNAPLPAHLVHGGHVDDDDDDDDDDDEEEEEEDDDLLASSGLAMPQLFSMDRHSRHLEKLSMS